jgi:hypothetical protein
MLSYSPDAVTESLEAMTDLLRLPAWRDSSWAPQMRARLASHLDDQRRHLRWLAAAALPLIYPDPGERAAHLTRRIDLEDEPTLLELNLRMLGSIPYESADAVLAAACGCRTAGPPLPTLLGADDQEEDLRELRMAWVTAHLNCHLQADTAHASAMVHDWFNQPASHGDTFRTAVASLRDVFSFAATDPLRSKAFGLVRAAVSTLSTDPNLAQTDAPTVMAIDSLVEQLYFASGAFDADRDGTRPTTAQRLAWYADAAQILEGLAAVVTYPHTCYQMLETLEYFVDDDPTEVFRQVSATVKQASLFRFEPVGVELAVKIVNRYLADYRHLFADAVMVTELRRILEVFALVGWPAALHLSYSLGDVFR